MDSFVSVILRGIILSSQAFVLGGVAVAFLILRPLALKDPELLRLLRRSLGFAAAGALGVAVTQAFLLALQMTWVADESGWPLRAALHAAFFWASLIKLLACLAAIGLCVVLRRGSAAPGSWAALIGAALVLGAASAWMSHAAARLEGRGMLLGLDALHQVAGQVWVGGLAHLVALAIGRGEHQWPVAILRRFSALAVAAVASLLGAGLALSFYYVDGLGALIGTAYGAMVLTKGVLFATLAALGGLNFVAVRRLPAGAAASPARLWQFVEVEVGLGITVFFTAASLTSLPPAIDVLADRAALAEVAARFTPEWPSLKTPSIDELLATAAPITDLRATRKPEEYAWSEYNHHLAGIFVLSMGLLALLEGTGRAPWARHWPLLFLGLAGVLFVRNDPRAWPLGPAGFWESMALPDVLQHRLFVLLIVAFGLFEWVVRAGRLRSTRWALVFPLVCAVGGGVLLTHSHASFNLKAEYLIEVTHIPLGVLAVFAGWVRWLELRLPPRDARIPGRLWALGFVLIGLLLLFYREH